jgi:hypothetical protein
MNASPYRLAEDSLSRVCASDQPASGSAPAPHAGFIGCRSGFKSHLAQIEQLLRSTWPRLVDGQTV